MSNSGTDRVTAHNRPLGAFITHAPTNATAIKGQLPNIKARTMSKAHVTANKDLKLSFIFIFSVIFVFVCLAAIIF